MFALSKAFFDLSPEVKAKYRFDLVRSQRPTVPHCSIWYTCPALTR